VTPHGHADPGGDRELWAVLVALEPLDSRKWDYLDLQRRTFQTEAMLDESWSSGEHVLIQVAQSLWNDGKVDLGYIASALGGQHLQVIIDAVAIRAGQPLRSDTGAAITRISATTLRRGQPPTPGSPDRGGPERALRLDEPSRAPGLEQ
jgi:hypothetical protein